MIDLSERQMDALHKIKAWHEDATMTGFARPFRLFGYAGTGKTTLAKHLGEFLGLREGEVVFGAYTGKAAHVLRSKGCSPASTIHSAIYLPTSSEEARHALALARNELSELTWELALTEEQAARKAELEAQLPELEAAARRVTWELNPMCDWASAKLIVLDEVSMVDAKLAGDIEKLGVPVLVLGDPAQLPPVSGEGYYIDATPDVLLTEIHRTALENPITALATRVRESTGPTMGLTAEDTTPVSVAEAMEHDQILVWSNKRRWAIIDVVRKRLGYPAGVPVAGDKVMCLTNNRDLAVFNGQLFDVIGSTPGTLGPTLLLRDDQGRERAIPCFSEGFEGREAQDMAKNSGAGRKGNRMLATFAQAITVHKAQGSEWPKVYVVNEIGGIIAMTAKGKGLAAAQEQARQWIYTAATRAQETLTITAPTGRR